MECCFGCCFECRFEIASELVLIVQRVVLRSFVI